MINTDKPTLDEVKSAIQSLKTGKSPGIDMIHAETFKDDLDTTSEVLHDLFSSIWDNDCNPEDWTKGFMVKLPKMRDLPNRNNWRGITLLSIPSKDFFCKILLNWIEKALEDKLRDQKSVV